MKRLLIALTAPLIYCPASAQMSCEEYNSYVIASQSASCAGAPACGSSAEVNFGNPSFSVVGGVDGYGFPTLYWECKLYHCSGDGTQLNNGGNLSVCSSDANAIPSKVAKSIMAPACVRGSIVQIENQILGETVPLVGSSFSLNYFSNWVAARTGDYTLQIPIAGAIPRDDIASFDVVVKLNGSALDSASYVNDQSNVSYIYTWDGKVSGNHVLGSREFEVSVTEHHTGISFPIVSQIKLGSFNAKLIGLGGWLPSNYHFYDALSKKLFRGDGSVRKTEALPWNTTGFMIAEEDGSKVDYFDDKGKILSTKTGLTGATVVTFNYDSQGRLTSITEAFGKTTTFNRNLNGDLVSITTPNGHVTGVNLNGNGYISSITNPNNESYSMTYFESEGLLATFVKPGGQTSTFTYDTHGNLINDQHSGGFFFDLVNVLSIGNQSNYTKTSKMSRATSYQTNGTDDGVNRVIYLPNEQTEGYSYTKSSGSGSENYGANGVSRTSNFTSDARFPTMATFPNSIGYQYGPVSYYIANTQNINLSDPEDPFSISTYSINSQKDSFSVTTDYNPSTKVFTTTTGIGRTSQTTIDTYERVISLKQGNLYSTDFTYTNENLTKIKQNTREINIAYNSTTGFLSSITNPLSQVTGFTYDNAGRVTAKTLPDLRVIGYSYDANGSLTGITPPSRPVHSFGINASELLSSYAPPTLSGVSVVNTTYSYNDDKQLTQILKPTGSSIDLTYNVTTGVLESITVPAGVYTYTMSTTNGLPSSIVSPNNGPITNINYAGTIPTQVATYTSGWTQISDYTANLSSNGTMGSDVVTGASATSTINYTYDNDEVLKTAGDIVLTYNTPNGQLTGLTMGTSSTTGFTDIYTYNSYGEVATYTAKRGSTTIYTLSLGRDGLGRINSKTEFMNAVTNSYAYTFDSTGRLTQTDKNAVTVATYGYDSNSNRNSGTIGSQVTTASYNNQDWMTAYNTLTFNYNANGDLQSRTNTTTSTTTQYVYDVFGNLTQVTLPNGTVITYEIDGLNRRIGKKVNGVLQKRWVYMDQTRIAAELNASGGIAKRFIYTSKGNIPDYMIVGTTKYRIISDHLGSVRLVIKQSDGSIAQRMNHDEFGRVTEDTNPGYLPFGFAGGLYDHHTQLVRFGARDYDPEVGRWTSKDPILFGGRQTNLYGYSFMDPINFIDPTGLDACGMNQGSGTVVCIDNNGNLSAVDRNSYSGNGSGKNNPFAQNIQDTGPIPTGSYIIGPSGPGGHMGPDTRHLTPTPGTRASFPSNRNPDTFNWHGDSRSNPGGASQGCPISGSSTRNAPYTGSPFDVNNISF